MSLLSCPDVNVWLALLRADHIHRQAATAWWTEDQSDELLFCRFTQLGVLRLLTTAAAMNNQPLSMRKAWAAYDRLLQDPRVVLVPEPPGFDTVFRTIAVSDVASPKVWADAYLLAFANQTGSRLVTFDKGLAARATSALLLA
jgi:toxin-antitoxin system PIN domain toxin